MVDPVERDDELREVAAATRAAWRADEEQWARAAFEAWEHDRTLLDVARECMHRGDTVAIALPGRTFLGAVASVGNDRIGIATNEGPVDVQVIRDAPIAVRVVKRARVGGTRGEHAVVTFRARLLQLETDAESVELGVPVGDGVLNGRLRVGRDQVSVTDRDGCRCYVSIGSVSWVRPVDVD
jgi:hypothetical protein